MKAPRTTSDKGCVREETRWLVVSGLVFFGGAFLYLWLRIDPHLLYRAFGVVIPETPLFSSGWAFWWQSLSVPAGIVTYVSGLLSQGYYYAWAGALILVLVAALLTELVRRHLAYAGLPRPALVVCLPAVALFLIANQYRHPLLPALTVSMGLLFSLVFEMRPWRQPAIGMTIYSVLAVVGYAFMGAGGVYVFAALTTIYLVLLRRQWLASAFVVGTSAAVIWCFAEYVYFLPPGAAFLIATPWWADMSVGLTPFSRMLLVGLYGFVPVAVLLMLIGKIAWSRRKSPRRPRKAKKDQGGRSALAPVARIVPLSLPVVVLAIGLPLTYEKSAGDFVKIHTYARQGQWSQLLDLARRLPKARANIACNHEINRALYHTGRLPYEMFSFPQNPHALLLTHEPRPSSLTQLQLCELFIELGNLNTAEKMAGELLATEGNLGTVLEKLAWINIIRSQNETAQVYLNVLRKDPIYHDAARGMLDGLHHGFASDRAVWIDRIRSCMPTDPYGVTYGGSVEQILTGLLERNPHNKMAFEYLMACHLLTRQLDKVIANLGRLEAFDYDGIPTYYEEAILISHTMRRQPIDPAALGISPATYERYKSFLQISRSRQAAKQPGALNRLVREFGSSYFFYYGFGRVGVVTLDAAGHRPVAKAE